MKRIKYNGFLFLAVASLVLSMSVGMAYGAAQSSTNYAIKADGLSGGGGNMGSTNYGLKSTLDQPSAIGISSSSNYHDNAGFWFPAGYYTPTAVFLTSFKAYEDGGQVVVEWETASETGTVGFYLLRLDGKTGKYLKVNNKFLPGLLHAPQGGVYRCVDETAEPYGTYRYKLVEVEIKGKKRTYGPFTVTVGDEGTFGSGGMFAQYDMEVLSSGYSRKAHKMSGPKKARIESRVSVMEAATELIVSDEVKIALDLSGLYYVDASEIADVMGETTHTIENWIRQKRLILSNQGQKVAWLAAEGNFGIYFYGEAVDTIYTNENIYQLTKGRKGEALTMEVLEGQGPSPASGYETFMDMIHIEEDHFALTALFEDPKADYWLWDYIIAGDDDLGSKSFTLIAAGAVETGKANLTVHLQGISDTDSDPDHHVEVFLNGTFIGEGYWDGASAHELVCEFDHDLLEEGDNTIEVTGLLDTGVPYSIFYVGSFDLTYERYYDAVDDRLLARGDGNDVITVEGYTNDDIFVFELDNPKKPKFIKATTVDGSDGIYRISFIPDSPETEYLTLTFDAASAPVYVIPDVPSNLKQKRNRAEYLVIAPSDLIEAAERLADFRQSQRLDTMVVDLEDIYDEFNYGLSSPEAIQNFLSYAYHKWRKPPRYVVLAGEGTYDYKDNQGYGDNVLPPLMVSTPHGLFASDNRLVDVEGDDGIPEMAIGRLPVVTSEELDAFIDKIIAFETSGGDWTKNVLMLADNPDDGGNFPTDSDAVAELLPPEYTAVKIYLSEHTIGEARELIQSGINRGALLLNYVGHSGLDLLAQEGMLTSSDVGSLINGDRLPVVTAMTCVAGQFSIPGYDSLGEVLVLHEGGGAIATWAPTGFSLNELAVILDKGFFSAAFEDEEKILGDVVLRALENYAWSGKKPYMMDIYNLLGDPGLEMR